MPASPLIGNKNAEIWTEEESISFLKKCIELAKQKEDYSFKDYKLTGFSFHFIGEICAELEQYSDLPLYLKGKSNECKRLYKNLKTQLESNCFSDSKKGIIKEASAIMNLKSNYGWTDRVDNTTKGEATNKEKTKIVFKGFGKDGRE